VQLIEPQELAAGSDIAESAASTDGDDATLSTTTNKPISPILKNPRFNMVRSLGEL
jgi:hypothetical protein